MPLFLCFADTTTGLVLKNPSSSAFDFTYQSPSDSKIESLSEMILVQISKQSFLERRNSSLFNCNYDSFGNEFCPSNLAKAESYWDYENGYAVSGVGQVVDYTKKENSTTYTQADYQLQTYVATCPRAWCREEDYVYKWQNVMEVNPAISYYLDGTTGVQVAVTNKIRIRIKDGSLQKYNNSWENVSEINILSGGTIDYTTGSGEANYNTKKIRFLNGYMQEYGLIGCSNGKKLKDYCGDFWNAEKYYIYDWINVSEISFVTSAYVNYTTGTGVINFETSKFRLSLTCPNGNVLENNQCKTSVTKCPVGYTETVGAEVAKGECKRTVEYTYYNYLCNNSQNSQGYNYLPINSGGNTGKIDPNNTTINNDLSTPLNSSTSPVNNCKRQKFTCLANAERPCSYVDNQWQCSPFPCFGQSNLENLDTQVGIDDKNNDGWSEDGSCAGTIYIFNGKSNK